jgi:hypothetical protein
VNFFIWLIKLFISRISTWFFSQNFMSLLIPLSCPALSSLSHSASYLGFLGIHSGIFTFIDNSYNHFEFFEILPTLLSLPWSCWVLEESCYLIFPYFLCSCIGIYISETKSLIGSLNQLQSFGWNILSVEQDSIVACLRCCFSPLDLGYGSVGDHSPTCPRHWVWCSILLRSGKPAGIL